MVDAAQYGNWGRYINHSHQPNCKPVTFFKKGIPSLLIFSIKDIKPNEELTYDYKLDININDS